MAVLVLGSASHGAEITPGPSTDLKSIRASIDAATEGGEGSITVGPFGDYRTIQAAIDAANEGDVIR